MVAPNPLSEQDLVAARAELAAGKPVTVWFTSAAVGVPAGGSAKVISVDEPAEGDFIQVRAAGSRDTMFCSPGELTRSRPARKRVQQPAAGSPAPIAPAESAPRASVSSRESAPRVTASRVSSPPEAAPQKAALQKAALQKAALQKAALQKAMPQKAAPQQAGPLKAAPPKAAPPVAVSPRESTPVPAAPQEEKAPERPRSGGGRSASRPAEVSVTLSATAEGEWTVEVMIGKKRTVRATPVQPAEVAKAARSLPTAVAEAIESSLAAARQRQAERVERLSAELEAAQLALRELSG